MLTKTILGEAIGVQHGGIQDRTSSNTVQGITHGLIIGKFKRGRTDQPMRINKDTIKARLGYEPNNPFYQVVQDCVDKFPSVWVLRVGASNGGGGVVVPPIDQISCEGATSGVALRLFGIWSFTIDGGESIEVTVNNLNDGAIAIAAALSDYGLAVAHGYDAPTEINYLVFSNTSNENRRIELIQVESDGVGQCLLNYVQNPAFNIIEGSSSPNDDNRLNFSKATVCLAPAEQIGFCDGATDSATIGTCSAGGILEYFVNDVSLGSDLGRGAYAGAFEGQGLRVIPIKSNGSVDMGYPNYSNTEYQRFENLTANIIRVRVETIDAPMLKKQLGEENPTVTFTNTIGVSIAEFCLLPVCVPSEEVYLDGRYDTLLDGHNTLTYKLNEGSIQTFTSSATNLDEFLSQLRENLGFVDDTATYRVLDSIAGAGAFKFTNLSGDNGVVLGLISSDKNGLFDVSTTLELIMVDSPNDFVTRFIGESVTLHSCSVLDFQ